MDALAIGGTDLEGLEEVSRQSDFRAGGYVPKCGRRGNGFGFGVSANLTHAKVAREKKPVAQEPTAAPAAPTAEAPQARSVVGRLIASYPEIVEVLRDRTDWMDISRL